MNRQSEVDGAVAAARAVVGLYGDPHISWAIGLELQLSAGLSAARPESLTARAAQIVAGHPHLGAPPVAEVIGGEAGWSATRTRLLDAPFTDTGPLIRLAADETGGRLLVVCHHGAVDGLGLVGLAGLLLDLPLGTSARGVARTGAEPGFVRGNLGRLREAIVAPPSRFAATVGLGSAGDWTAWRGAVGRQASTSALSTAVLRALGVWNAPGQAARPVLALGVSRRSGRAPLEPRRDTAYTRLRLEPHSGSDEVAAQLAGTSPEPDFPARTRPGLMPLVTRVLGKRLGSTALVSNLGLVVGDDGRLQSAAFWPAPAGPHGVAVGLVTAGELPTVSVRMRRGWFGEPDAERLVGLVLDNLAERE